MQNKIQVHKQKKSFQATFLHAFVKNIGVSKNRGTPKWMVYNGKPC